MCELATRHHEAEKQGVLMRNVTGTISHPEGETMAMDVTYSIKRMAPVHLHFAGLLQFQGQTAQQ